YRRFSSNDEHDGTAYFNNSVFVGPLVVTFPGKARKCRSIFTETIKAGTYKVVWCFSRSQSSVTPSRLNFEVKSKVDTSQATMSAEWCQIKHDEIRKFR
ncbi:hypothetical protein BGX27_005213, partial [Mortierella sp. AM989]